VRRARVREWLNRQPFGPFHVHVVDGNKYTIFHPDFGQLSHDGRELTVWYDATRKALIDAFFITALEEAAGSEEELLR
jgi:hypothetical protein